VFVAHLSFRYFAYDGEWLPNTYFAKAGGRGGDAWDFIRVGVVTPLGGVVAVTVGVAASIVWRASTWILPTFAVAVGGALLPFVTGTDWMPGERLLVPYLPLAAVVVAVGWTRMGAAIAAKPAWVPVVLLAAVPTIWMAQTRHRRALIDETSVRARGYRDGHAALANWLCMDVARPGEAIALMDIGIVGYHCIDQTIVDITGLTDRKVAKSPGRFLEKRYDPGYIFERKPRFIVIVIKQPGNPNGLPSNDGFATWTSIERDLVRHPEFNRWYRTPASAGPRDPSWQGGLAANFGAMRLFQHAHPGMFYLLTVFERQEVPAM
jgi:hypothetical protein